MIYKATSNLFLSGSSSPGMVWLPEHVRHWTLTLLQPGPELFKEHIMSFVQTTWCCKKLRAEVRVRVAVSILAKASFQKGFVSHCMAFLAVFCSQCLSAKWEKQNTTSGTATSMGRATTPLGMGQKPWRCYCSYRERPMTQTRETGLWAAKDTGSPSTSKIN